MARGAIDVYDIFDDLETDKRRRTIIRLKSGDEIDMFQKVEIDELEFVSMASVHRFPLSPI